MVNIDLPWNPMQIEQRLGRMHRVGQQHDVQLTNLVRSGTLEEHLIEVLQAKINLFELVVGELDMILGRGTACRSRAAPWPRGEGSPTITSGCFPRIRRARWPRP